ncbi:hypothetical protein GCM10027425_06000 [Alteromonas gracilis]
MSAPLTPAGPTDEVGQVEETLADRVAATVLAVPGVSGLHGGSFGEVATYLPGRQVAGVRTADDHTAVHISVAMDQPLLEVADTVRDQVAALTGGEVRVVVEDVTPRGSAAS